jgi:hypothetical protein
MIYTSLFEVCGLIFGSVSTLSCRKALLGERVCSAVYMHVFMDVARDIAIHVLLACITVQVGSILRAM